MVLFSPWTTATEEMEVAHIGGIAAESQAGCPSSWSVSEHGTPTMGGRRPGYESELLLSVLALPTHLPKSDFLSLIRYIPSPKRSLSGIC